MEEICKNCKYFIRYAAEISIWSGKEKPIPNFGYCWRFPPITRVGGMYADMYGKKNGNNYSLAIHPNVHESDFCGEFKSK